MSKKFWVFDTNTLLSALLNENSVPGLALKKARETGTLLISPSTAAEYFTTFTKPKFDKYLSLEIRIAFIENIISNALSVEIKEIVTVCRDPKDNMFLSLALSAKADALVTGDKDLLVLHPFRGIPILQAGDFLAVVSAINVG
ncbi:MAG TPA: putative toxin-antitoxin system toxin component, PIN family [Cyclobacteriaceae bacterium]|nr:putative toxin-antitoxin system toxin component, PIN family [Cyclobacteriaceae bacterium]